MAGTPKLNPLSICYFFILLLVFNQNASAQTQVRYLPGFDGPLPFELETGYVTADDSNGVELFYYFVKSENNPVNDPLILWLTGGPGCSVLSAFALELGPLLFKHVRYDGSLPGLELNPYSWTKVSNIIFLDAPVATGFSYSKTPQGSTCSDTLSAKHITTFLKKWLYDHPDFLSNHLYIGGDSYSGIIVPIVVQDISQDVEKSFINLKGYLLGNPVTDQVLHKNLRVPFLRGMGIISLELFESAMENCKGDFVNVSPYNVKCRKSIEAISECSSGLYDQQILDPKCGNDSPADTNLFGDKSLLEKKSTNSVLSVPREPTFECKTYPYMLSYYWANDIQVQMALNIRKGTTKEWVRCSSSTLRYLLNVNSSIDYHLNLSKKGHYRSLIYNGDHDMIIPFGSTQEWIRSLKYSITDEWRPWFVDTQVAGYTRTYANNMTFATVKGGGHVAPEYKPNECLDMVKRWLSYDPL